MYIINFSRYLETVFILLEPVYFSNKSFLCTGGEITVLYTLFTVVSALQMYLLSGSLCNSVVRSVERYTPLTDRSTSFNTSIR